MKFYTDIDCNFFLYEKDGRIFRLFDDWPLSDYLAGKINFREKAINMEISDDIFARLKVVVNSKKSFKDCREEIKLCLFPELLI